MNSETVELKIIEHTEKLEKHDERIGSLEKSDVKQEGQIGMLCDKLDKIIESNQKWFYLAITVIMGVVGFLIKHSLF